MGTLTATLPNGTVHSWTSDSPQRIARFLERFRQHLLEHIRQDPDVSSQLGHYTDAEALQDYCYGMARHVLSTEVSSVPGIQQWRQMFLTYLLLAQKSQDPIGQAYMATIW
jgi:hypothetical protein